MSQASAPGKKSFLQHLPQISLPPLTFAQDALRLNTHLDSIRHRELAKLPVFSFDGGPTRPISKLQERRMLPFTKLLPREKAKHPEIYAEIFDTIPYLESISSLRILLLKLKQYHSNLQQIPESKEKEEKEKLARENLLGLQVIGSMTITLSHSQSAPAIAKTLDPAIQKNEAKVAYYLDRTSKELSTFIKDSLQSNAVLIMLLETYIQLPLVLLEQLIKTVASSPRTHQQREFFETMELALALGYASTAAIAKKNLATEISRSNSLESALAIMRKIFILTKSPYFSLREFLNSLNEKDLTALITIVLKTQGKQHLAELPLFIGILPPEKLQPIVAIIQGLPEPNEPPSKAEILARLGKTFIDALKFDVDNIFAALAENNVTKLLTLLHAFGEHIRYAEVDSQRFVSVKNEYKEYINPARFTPLINIMKYPMANYRTIDYSYLFQQVFPVYKNLAMPNPQLFAYVLQTTQYHQENIASAESFDDEKSAAGHKLKSEYFKMQQLCFAIRNFALFLRFCGVPDTDEKLPAVVRSTMPKWIHEAVLQFTQTMPTIEHPVPEEEKKEFERRMSISRIKRVEQSAKM